MSGLRHSRWWRVHGERRETPYVVMGRSTGGVSVGLIRPLAAQKGHVVSTIPSSHDQADSVGNLDGDESESGHRFQL